MNKILITGGLGYVGGRLVSYILENTDAEILVSSRRVTNMAEIFNSDRVIFQSTADLIDFTIDLPEGVDSIIHLSSTNELQSLSNPVDSIEVNIRDSYILLQKAIKKNVKRFVYMSTAHVYGSPLVGHITEESCPKPLHPYSITHKAFEDFLWAAHDKKEIEAVIIRLSNSYGAPAFPDTNRWTLLVNDLCKQAITNKQLVIKSSGLQLRDFVTLTDVCRAVHHLLFLPTYKLKDGVFNLGGNHVISVLDMAILIRERFEDEFNMSLQISRLNFSGEDVIRPFEYCSIRLADSGFVWEQNTNREIDELINFCFKNFS